MDPQYRYPGTRSFERKEADVFFGREGDTQQLWRLLRLEQLVVLYGKSGLGKSSLINAGILPLVDRFNDRLPEEEEEADRLAIEEIRFGAFQKDSRHPLEVLRGRVAAEPLAPLLAGLEQEAPPLWLACKNRQLQGDGQETLLLIFDQFEELFTYPEEQVREFKEALADLAQATTPTGFRRAVFEKSRAAAGQRSKADFRELLRPLRVKILLTVRSDRLSLLDQFTTHIPNVLVNLFELKPLDRLQARAAIVEPARKESPAFLSPPFAFADEALATILNGLSNDKGEIESFQLQLLCQDLEQRVIRDPQDAIVEEADFGGAGGIQDILQNYYERQLSGIPDEQRLVARRFIEEGLIVDGRRGAVVAGAEQSRFGVDPALLRQLLDSRLIRAETIHLGKIYELSHDTLVDPVLRSYRLRQEEEKRLEIERELAEEKRRRQEIQKRRRRARLFAILGFTLFALAAVAGILALSKYREAEAARRKASASALAARAWEIYRTDHTLAARIAEAALRIDSANEEVRQTLSRIINSPRTSFYQLAFAGHDFHVSDAAFSPDGQLIASVGFDQKLLLWEPTGELRWQVLGKNRGEAQPGHGGDISAVTFTTDGQQLVTVGADRMIKVWEVADGTLVREWEGHSGAIEAVEVVPGTPWIVTGGREGTAIVWTLEGTEVRRLLTGSEGLTDVVVSADGRYILTTGREGVAGLWQTDGRLVRRIEEPGQLFEAGAISPDNRYLLLACNNGTAEIRDFDGRKLQSLGGHRGEVVDLAFFPSEPLLITASEDGQAKVWTLAGEEMLTLTGHKKALGFVEISPDGATILTGGYDFTVKSWDVAFNLDLQRRRHTDFIYCVDIHPDDRFILTGSKDYRAKLWTLDGHWVADLQGHRDRVQTSFFIPETEEVVTASNDGTCRVWNYQGDQLLLLDHPVPVRGARATAGRERIVTAAADGMVRVWDHDGQLQAAWLANPSGKSVFSVDIHPDGTQFLSSHGPVVQIWDWEGNRLDSFSHDTGAQIYKAFYGPQGASIFTAAREFPVKEWLPDGTLKQVYRGHTDVVYWLSVDAGNNRLATASWDQTLKIWDLSGQLLHSIPHPNSLYTVAWAGRSDLLVSGSHDNIGRIWTPEGELIGALGERVRIEPFLQAPEMAPLTQIPFSLTEENLPSIYLEALAGDDPAQYLKEADYCIGLARENRFDLSEKLAYFDQAAAYSQKAIELDKRLAQDESLLQQLAVLYKEKGEQLLVHRRFGEAVAAARQGLIYAETDQLLVLLTLANLYDGRVKAAADLVRTNLDRPTPQIEWAANYQEAVQGDLVYFEEQFGITHPDAELLVELLGVEEEE